MKTMKYRSVITSIFVLLSVFLFTSCEKDTDLKGSTDNTNMIEKFKRLKFQTIPTSDGTSIGGFTGTSGGGITFTPPSGSGGTQFSGTSGSRNLFTDPTSSNPYFGVNGFFGQGGGSFTLNGKKVDLAFGFCGQDIFGELDGNFSNDDLEKIDIFIGIAGQFSIGDTSDLGIDYILYAISYNGGTKLNNLNDFDNDDNFDNLAFVLVIEFNEELNESKVYLSTSGTITFSESQLTLGNVKLVDEDGDNNGSLDASLECIQFDNF